VVKHQGTPSFQDVGKLRRGLKARGKGDLLDVYSFTQNDRNVKGEFPYSLHKISNKSYTNNTVPTDKLPLSY
jgi:hypothetical protein